MNTDFKRHGIVDLYTCLPHYSKIVAQLNYHYSWGTSVSVLGWKDEQSAIDLAAESDCIVAAWHIKGTKQFNNSPTL